MDTSDSSAARSFLDHRPATPGRMPTSYGGVSYQATASGLAFGLVGPLRGDRQRIGGARRDRHRPRGLDARGIGRLRQAARGGTGRRARPPLHRDPSRRPRARHATGASGLLGAARRRSARPTSRCVPAAGSLTLDADTLPAARRSAAAGCCGRPRRRPGAGANCRRNPGWRSASATSAATSGQDVAAAGPGLAGERARRLEPGRQRPASSASKG